LSADNHLFLANPNTGASRGHQARRRVGRPRSVICGTHFNCEICAIAPPSSTAFNKSQIYDVVNRLREFWQTDYIGGQEPMALSGWVQIAWNHGTLYGRTAGMSKKTILITGVSSGLGKALAGEALRQGWRVVGTVRKEADRQNFEATNAGRAIGRILDITDTAAVPKVVAEVETAVGAVDVLVNNAGYGLFATIEEAPLEEVRQQFETNVFGQIAVLQAVLP
jgi:hypothetical protein